jgi:hypothetical protein
MPPGYPCGATASLALCGGGEHGIIVAIVTGKSTPKGQCDPSTHRNSNGGSRRVSLIPVRPGDGLLSELIAGARGRQREPPFMPPQRTFVSVAYQKATWPWGRQAGVALMSISRVIAGDIKVLLLTHRYDCRCWAAWVPICSIMNWTGEPAVGGILHVGIKAEITPSNFARVSKAINIGDRTFGVDFLSPFVDSFDVPLAKRDLLLVYGGRVAGENNGGSRSSCYSVERKALCNREYINFQLPSYNNLPGGRWSHHLQKRSFTNLNRTVRVSRPLGVAGENMKVGTELPYFSVFCNISLFCSGSSGAIRCINGSPRLSDRESRCDENAPSNAGISNGSFGSNATPFEMFALILATVMLCGAVISVKGIDRPDDTAFFGDSALLFVAAFLLTLLMLRHFLPPHEPSDFSL